MSGLDARLLRVRDLFPDGTGIVVEPGGRVLKLVPGTAPGDLVRPDAAGGWRLLEPSPARATPRCPLFARCAGCVAQHLSPPGQASWKRGLVREPLRRIGKLTEPPVADTLSPGPAYGYRNKLVLTFGGDPLTLGYREPGREGRVLPVPHCHLAPPWMAETAARVLAAVRNVGGSGWCPGGERGVWRKLVLREGSATGQRMAVVLTTSGLPADRVRALGEDLRAALGSTVTTALHGVSAKGRDTDLLDSSTLWWGPGWMEERLAGLTFRISPNSFFQVNTAGAERLVSLVLDRAGSQPGAYWLDLFCGAGTFTLPLATRVPRVLGADASAEAIRDARVNARVNGLAHARFEEMDLQREARRLLAEGNPDGVLVDPPRSGLAPWLTAALRDSRLRRLLYVSCDPASLARDAAALCGDGRWRLALAQPVELFPQTGHVETLAEFAPA